MEESSPSESGNVSSSGRRNSSDNEHSLHSPLLPDSKTPKSRASSLKKDVPEADMIHELFRDKSAPKPDEGKLDILKSLDENRKHYSILYKAILGAIVYFAVGVITFYIAEEDLVGTKSTSKLIDALYFSVVTLTNVGYGDLVPGTKAGKLFTCAYVFIGFGLLGALISGAADLIVGRQEEIVVHAMKKREHQGYEQAEYDNAMTATYKAYVSGVLVIGLGITGLAFLLIVEKMEFVDAFYCVCVTVTTLGYGDLSFETAGGRLFAAIWLLCSTVFVAQLFLHVAQMRTEQRQLDLARFVFHRKTTKVDLEAADLDKDGGVSWSEFVIFKLKELGKLDEEDLDGILNEFRSLDYDHSGSLSTHDSHFSES